MRKAVARCGKLNGIEAHVAGNFGLIAAAGEIAIWAKIIPAEKGDALSSALTIFERHILDRRRSPHVRSGEDAFFERLSQLKGNSSRFPRKRDIEAGEVTDPKIWGYTQNNNGELQMYVEKNMLKKSFPDHPIGHLKQILENHNKHIRTGRESPYLDRKIANYPGERGSLKFVGIRL